MEEPPDWRLEAKCRRGGRHEMPVDFWFPHDAAGVERAIRFCRGVREFAEGGACPVVNECLDDALRLPSDQQHGVLGGASERERVRIRKSRQRSYA